VDGLFRCAATPVLFRACEAYIMTTRENPADEVEDYADRLELTAEERDMMRWRVYDELKADKTLRFVTVGDMSEWFITVEGVAHRAYWCLKDSGLHQFSTPEKALKYVKVASRDWLSGFLRANGMISGLDLMSSMDWPEASEEEKREPAKYRPMGWRRLYRKFAEAYYWDKDTVNSLTLYDLKTYTCDEKLLGGTKTVSHADFIGRQHMPRGKG
jgi:hypothetical protein